MLFSLMKFLPKSRFSSSSRGTARCNTKTKLHSYMKEAFLQNLEKTKEILYTSDLEYTNLVASNMLELQIKDEDLQSGIMVNAEYHKGEINPENLVQTVTNLGRITTHYNANFFTQLWAYIENINPILTEKQLLELEKTFFHLSNRLIIEVPSSFGTLLAEAKVRKMYKLPVMNDKSLQARIINPPEKHLEVISYEPEARIKIRFKNFGKTVTFFGISDTNPESMYNLQQYLNKKEFDAFLIGLPPVTKEDVIETKQNTINSLKNAHLDEDLIKKTRGDNYATHPYMDLFEKNGEIAVFDRIFTQWYVDNVLRNEKLYIMNEREGTVKAFFEY